LFALSCGGKSGLPGTSAEQRIKDLGNRLAPQPQPFSAIERNHHGTPKWRAGKNKTDPSCKAPSYVKAQERLVGLYPDPEKWARKVEDMRSAEISPLAATESRTNSVGSPIKRDL